jgi:integrase
VAAVLAFHPDPSAPDQRAHYTRDVEQVLIPWLGSLCLANLDGPRLRATFAEIAKTTNRKGAPQSPAAMQHLRTTLRAALNLAVREGLIDTNPARHTQVTGYRRPHAQVWTDDRVAKWRATAARPAVGVWTVEQLACFLTAVVDDSLFALWWLIALRGLRRGEACGLRWSEVDLDHGVLFIVRNRTTAGYQVIEGPPKTPAGIRAVALDKQTVRVLREHRRRQLQQTRPPPGRRQGLARQRLPVHPRRRHPHPPRLRQRPLPPPGRPTR